MILRRPSLHVVLAGWGAITFGALLASFTAFRPVRDALVLDGSPDDIPWLFTATFLAVTIVSPLWSALLGKVGRRRCVPLAFHAFAVCALGFAAVVAADLAPVAVGRVFYVWSSVYNLFVVSVFWSLLADLLGPSVARRLYGPIAAGGTIGAFLGPLLTRTLVDAIDVHGILVVSALLLEVAVFGVWRVRRAGERLAREDEAAAPPADQPTPGGAFQGLARVARSPYLLAIVAYVLCTATAATFMYLEQAKLVKDLLPDRVDRTELFASIDLWTNAGTFALQSVFAAPLLGWLGPGLVLIALPFAQGIGISVIVFAPSLAALTAVQTITRAFTHGLTRPARELLFTVVSTDDKYRAKNVIDTIVYRFGDFGSAWLHKGLIALGAGSVALVAAMVPVVALWTALAVFLGAGFRRRRSHAAEPPPDTATG